jgi:hypothetical protein
VYSLPLARLSPPLSVKEPQSCRQFICFPDTYLQESTKADQSAINDCVCSTLIPPQFTCTVGGFSAAFRDQLLLRFPFGCWPSLQLSLEADQGEQIEDELKIYSTFVVMSDKCVQASRLEWKRSGGGEDQHRCQPSRAEHTSPWS